MKPRIVLTLLIAISFISLVQGSTTYLDSGQCYNLTYQEAFHNETSNETLFLNQTRIFCVKDTNETLYDYEVPIFIEGDGEWIKVTVGTDTQSFPRSLGYFNYEAEQIFSCPVRSEVAEGDPQSLRDCLAILKETKELTSEDKDDYKKCITERDNFKVEWEKRGIEIETKNSIVSDCESGLKLCEDKKQSSGISNVVLIIIVIILLVIAAFFTVLRIREGSSSVNNLA